MQVNGVGWFIMTWWITEEVELTSLSVLVDPSHVISKGLTCPFIQSVEAHWNLKYQIENRVKLKPKPSWKWKRGEKYQVDFLREVRKLGTRTPQSRERKAAHWIASSIEYMNFSALLPIICALNFVFQTMGVLFALGGNIIMFHSYPTLLSGVFLPNPSST